MLGCLFVCGLAWAGPPEETPTPEAKPAQVEAVQPEIPRDAGRPPAADPQGRADEVQALLDGTLDPLVDAQAVLDADDPALVQATIEGPLHEALAAFAALDGEERVDRLEQHAARRRLAILGDEWVQTIRARTDGLDRRDRSIRRFLAADPTYGLARGSRSPEAIDLLELVASSDELEPLEPPRKEDDTPRSAPEIREQALAELQAARERLRESAAALARLDDGQRDALRDRQRYFDLLRQRMAQAHEGGEEEGVEEAARAEAAKAERERDKALLDVQNAKTERERRQARAKADILAVQAEQATARADLERDRAALDDRGEAVDELLARASSVVEAAESPTQEPSEDPDVLYAELSGGLDDGRDALKDAMGRVRTPPTVATGERVSEQDLTAELAELRAELIAAGKELNRGASELEWTRADVIFAEVESLNLARLSVLRVASSQLRASVRGFGSEGLRAVELEVEQISLTLRYRALAYRRTLEGLRTELAADWLSFAFGLLKVIGLVIALMWWRRRADTVLGGALERLREQETTAAQLWSRLIWYVMRIRKPLEWLVVLTVLLNVLESALSLPSLTLALIVTRWLCIGSASILLVDAIASRDTNKDDELAKLRIRSIRLVGLTIVWTGLFMSLVEALVGRGAIHAWSWRVCWLALIPVAVLLTRWWRSVVLSRLKVDRGTGAFIEWAQRRSAQRSGPILVALVGVRYLGQAIARIALRRASRFDFTRRVLAFLVKREVQKKAEAEAAVEVLPPLEDALLKRLTAPRLDATVPGYGEEVLSRAEGMLEQRASASTVIIGERGLGKSVFLGRLAEAFGEERQVIRIRCEGMTFGQLLKQLAKALDVEPERHLVVKALEAGERPRLVLVDDLHRIVRPAMGGLVELDQFISLVHGVEGDVGWACTFGKEAWTYVERSRAGRVFFDQVLRLPAWTEAELGELVGQRCLACAISPDFSHVAVPSRFDDEELEDDERTRRGIMRLLWDYSDGNPLVALHFWGESLRQAEEGRVEVRLFQTPESATIDRLGVEIQFVLRALIQLDVATPRQVSDCTRLGQGDVTEALRFVVARGYAHRTGRQGVRISLPWFRGVTESLRRQHLLPR